MKFAIVAALLASAQAIKIKGDPEDEWLTIPKFTDSTTDKVSPPEEQWGHETQRVGHDDWLDGHVRAVAEYKDYATILSPPKLKERREAIADSF